MGSCPLCSIVSIRIGVSSSVRTALAQASFVRAAFGEHEAKSKNENPKPANVSFAASISSFRLLSSATAVFFDTAMRSARPSSSSEGSASNTEGSTEISCPPALFFRNWSASLRRITTSAKPCRLPFSGSWLRTASANAESATLHSSSCLVIYRRETADAVLRMNASFSATRRSSSSPSSGKRLRAAFSPAGFPFCCSFPCPWKIDRCIIFIRNLFSEFWGRTQIFLKFFSHLFSRPCAFRTRRLFVRRKTGRKCYIFFGHLPKKPPSVPGRPRFFYYTPPVPPCPSPFSRQNQNKFSKKLDR